jgi:glycyl-tRNA synthetase beta chain
MADLLLELFSEEIPARMQSNAEGELRDRIFNKLSLAGFSDIDLTDCTLFSTPRRIALAIKDLPTSLAATETELKGPKVGAPDAAMQGFL